MPIISSFWEVVVYQSRKSQSKGQSNPNQPKGTERKEDRHLLKSTKSRRNLTYDQDNRNQKLKYR